MNQPRTPEPLRSVAGQLLASGALSDKWRALSEKVVRDDVEDPQPFAPITDEERAKACEEAVGRALEVGGVPPYALHVRPKRYACKIELEPVFHRVREGGSVYLHGSYGTGKSWMAVALAAEWLSARARASPHRNRETGLLTARCPSMKVIVIPRFLAEVRAGYRDEEANPENLIESVSKVSFLIIDDLGRGKPSEHTEDCLYRIVDTRYGERLPTVVNSNYPLDELLRRVGGAVVDRLREICLVVRLKGPSKRVPETRI